VRGSGSLSLKEKKIFQSQSERERGDDSRKRVKCRAPKGYICSFYADGQRVQEVLKVYDKEGKGEMVV